MTIEKLKTEIKQLKMENSRLREDLRKMTDRCSDLQTYMADCIPGQH